MVSRRRSIEFNLHEHGHIVLPDRWQDWEEGQDEEREGPYHLDSLVMLPPDLRLAPVGPHGQEQHGNRQEPAVEEPTNEQLNPNQK